MTETRITIPQISTEITDPASDDLMVVRDVSAGSDKRLKFLNLIKGLFYTPPGTGAVTTTQKEVNDRRAHLFNYLTESQIADIVSRTGTTDVSAGYQKLIDYCSPRQIDPKLGNGIIRLNSQILLEDNPFIFQGQDVGSPQNGSYRAGTTLRWGGGATSMFLATSGNWGFANLGVENVTNATDFMLCTAGQRFFIQRLWALFASGTNRFSRSIFYSEGNNYGYSKFIDCHCLGAAPLFLGIDGGGSTNGLTPIRFYDGLFESNGDGDGNPMTVVKLIDTNIDILEFHGLTLNQQRGELCLIDNTEDTPAVGITSLIIKGGEFDTNTDPGSASATDRYVKLKNVANVSWNGTTCNGGGTVTGIANLENSFVSEFVSNHANSVGGPYFNVDSLSRVSYGVNQFDNSNTMGIVADTTKNYGQILRSQFDDRGTTFTTTSGTYVSSGLDVTVTPTNKYDKIIIEAHIGGIATYNLGVAAQFALYRGETLLHRFEGQAGFFTGSGFTPTEMSVGGTSIKYVDVTSESAAKTYSIRVRASTDGNLVAFNTSSGYSSISASVAAAQ